MNHMGEMIGAWHRERVLRFIKWLALAIAATFAILVGLGFLGYYREHRCTEADKALSQATNFRGPVDYQDAQAHPEKLRYARAQARAIQRCGW